MKDASKNLPRALLLVIIIVATIYILVVVSCVGILGSGLAHSSVPLQDAAQAVAGRAGEAIIVVGTFLSMGGEFDALYSGSRRHDLRPASRPRSKQSTKIIRHAQRQLMWFLDNDSPHAQSRSRPYLS